MEIQTKKISMYEKITSITLSICIVLLPIFIIPNVGINFFYSKYGLVTLAVLIGLIVLVLQVLSERSVERYGLLLNSALFAVPVAYVLSSLFGSHTTLSVLGSGAEIDTAYTVILGSLLAFLISRAFRVKKTIFVLSVGMLGVAFLISIFHVLRFIFGVDFLSLGVFNTVSSNTVGGFNELGIYAGLIAIISIIGIELLTLQKNLKIGLYSSLVFSLLIIAVSNFSLVSGVLGTSFSLSLSFIIAVFALVIFIHKKVVNPKSPLPKAALLTLLVSVVLTIASGPISTYIAPAVGITQQQVLDVRVSPGATLSLAGKTYSEGVIPTLFGTGPNYFFTAWAKYKPVGSIDSINVTDFWNVDFNLGSGFIPTSFVTSGVVGALAWMFFLVVLLFYISKLLKKTAKTEKDQLGTYISWVVSVGTVYLWLMAILFTTGPVLLFLAFAFTGLLIATLVREEIIKTKVITWSVATYWRGFFLTLSMIVLIVICMYFGYIWQQRLFASIQVQSASELLQKDNKAITQVQQKLLSSINTYYDPTTLRLMSDVSLIRPTTLIAQVGGVVPADKLTQDAVSDINLSIAAARRSAIDTGLSTDYRDWLQLGKAYETATFLGATSTANLAVQSYLQAESLNPTSPVPPYLIGRLYALARSFDVAAQKLQIAIDLKPNYTEAIDLLKSVKDAQGKGTNSQVIDAASPVDAVSSSATSTKSTTGVAGVKTPASPIKTKTAPTSTKAR